MAKKSPADASNPRKDARRRAIEEKIEARANECSDLLRQISDDMPKGNKTRDASPDERTLTIKSILNCYEQRYIRSDMNPVHAWAAIALCTDAEVGQFPLPKWCADYLQGIAKTVVSIDVRLTAKDAEPVEKGQYEQAANEAARALGFTSGRGRNAFKSAASDRKKIRVALATDELRMHGATMEESYQGAAATCGIADRETGTDVEYAKKLSTAGKRQLRRSPADGSQ